MFKEDLVLNNLHYLICHKIQPNSDSVKWNKILSEISEVTNTDMRKWIPQENKNDKNNLVYMKVANYAIEDLLQDFKPNLPFLKMNNICNCNNDKLSNNNT